VGAPPPVKVERTTGRSGAAPVISLLIIAARALAGANSGAGGSFSMELAATSDFTTGKPSPIVVARGRGSAATERETITCSDAPPGGVEGESVTSGRLP